MSIRTWFTDRPTFASILTRHRGIGPGFDFLRIGLAVAILYGHALWVAGMMPGTPTIAQAADAAAQVGESWEGLKRPLHVALVPMFFALSGFLVVGSALRVRTIRTFIALRLLRLLPSLMVEVTLCAVVLGAIFTTLPLADYFRSGGYYAYFLNIFGIVHFTLPEVFVDNPVSRMVNINLWTLPSELHCYLVLVGLMLTRILFHRTWFTALYAVAALILIPLNLFTDFGVTPGPVGADALVFYFCIGVLFFHWKDKIPFNGVLFIIAGIASYGLLLTHHGVFAACFALTYVTTAIGMMRIPKLPLIFTGDYSYGVYLYGFPISQAIVATFPELIGQRYTVLGLTLLFTGLFAAFSWHCIEKHCLKLKVYLVPATKKSREQRVSFA